MPPPDKSALAAQLQTVTADLAQDLADLGGRLLITIGDAPQESARIPTAHMPLSPIPGVYWLQLPCAHPETATCTRVISGGIVGAHSTRVRVSPTVRLRLNEGALLWWQESFGYDAGEPRRIRVEAPCDLHLVANELHSFVALDDFLIYSTFTPAL